MRIKNEDEIIRLLKITYEKVGNPIIGGVLFKILEDSPHILKILEKEYKKNLVLINLLVREIGNFQLSVMMIREKFGIPLEGFKNEEEYFQWIKNIFSNPDKYLNFFIQVSEKVLPKGSLVLKEIEEKMESLKNVGEKYQYVGDLFKEQVEGLIEMYHLSYNFCPYIENYILLNEIDAPFLNWSIDFEPKKYGVLFTPIGKIVKNWTRSVRHSGYLKGVRWINLKIYSPLSYEEIKIIKRVITQLSVHYFPSEISKAIDFYENPEKYIKILEKMPQRKMRKKELKNYLKLVKEKYGDKYFKDTLKKWKQAGETPYEEISGYTSKEIAEEIFGSRKKSDHVRKIYSELRKKGVKRFFGIE